MKKLTIGLAILFAGFAKDAIAYSNNPCSLNVSVPASCGGFTFGLTGLYWRPSISYLDYGFLTSTSTSFDNRFLHSDPDYDWGYKINAGYRFPCTGTDVALTYTYYERNHSQTDLPDGDILLSSLGFAAIDPAVFSPITLDGITVTGATLVSILPALPAVIFPGGTVIPDAGAIQSLATRVEVKHDAVDLDIGQHLSMGQNTTVRFFSGLRYANLEHKLDQTAVVLTEGSIPAVTTDFLVVVLVGETATTGLITTTVSADVSATGRDSINQKSEFNGVGPRFGTELNYTVGGGFGIVGSASASLLVGEGKSFIHTDVANTVALTPAVAVAVTGAAAPFITGFDIGGAADATVTDFAFTTTFHEPDVTRVIPNLDAKIGVNYSFQFTNQSSTRLSIEAGYCVSEYWNALDRLTLSTVASANPWDRRTMDISFNGPYISAQVVL